VGLHRNFVGMIERGERTPTIEVAHRLSKALGRRFSALVIEAEGDA
jgi:transcriptional regulator with XRE-family HTH domain